MKNRQASASHQGGQLRLIGGQWRGRKLSFPTPDGLRPTGDRIRETLFNWLQADVVDARCLDLFAGSGALGLEALSRGAAHCTLLELNKQAWQQLRHNCDLLKAQGADVLNVDSLAWLAQTDQQFDLIFLDPPFAQQLWQRAIELLNRSNCLSDQAIVYVESPKNLPLETPPHWHLSREKVAGEVCYRLYRLL
ncbi:16S rRNA (guanine(966)-N(2))-methyltransferase RsmD [Simiduia curdlanivorans]|uniref:Ribosomal RNA small subunit methyltransferase D n=1 Tax=Simiduia curdlanivorans TaxID=1492769 RepID=A0ABV8V2K1_9GAMM|nr:16S rRNA (guanine(966)-N(2))-methyltransferase RsmD [Simiduia curdlanivorans]MDN3637912.1 16S rRNA (guanine(966)-N(2))-methyltransferase RsmD [Simiduia curdlanivorans]